MRKIFLILFMITSAVGCKENHESIISEQEMQEEQGTQQGTQGNQENYVYIQTPQGDDLNELLDQVEHDATPEGRQILETARSMISTQKIVIGSCWDYMDAVYDQAQMQRETVFKSRFQGPYLDDDMIEAGDWLYFVNHSYHDGEHSGIFVAWLDYEKREALMINYVGENRIKPGTYKKYVIDEVYNIMRATN